MARTINAEHVQRGDLPRLPPPEIVVVHDDNTRLYEPDVSDLVASFRANGQLQACIGRPLPDGKIRLAAGFRRWLAGMVIWKEQEAEGIAPEDRFKLKIDIQKMSPEEALTRNIAENAERAALSPVECMRAILRLRDERGWIDSEGTAKIAALFKKSVSWVAAMEDLSGLSEAELFQVHRHFVTRGEEGIGLAVAQVLKTIPEEKREQALAEAAKDAEAASMKDKSHTPTGGDKRKGKKAKGAESTTGETSTTGAVPATPVSKEKATAKITARQMAKAAEKNGATTTRARQIKDVIEFVDGYFDGSEGLRPLHAITRELLKRITGYIAREITEVQLDNTIIKIDGCLQDYWDKYASKKK